MGLPMINGKWYSLVIKPSALQGTRTDRKMQDQNFNGNLH